MGVAKHLLACTGIGKKKINKSGMIVVILTQEKMNVRSASTKISTILYLVR